MTLGRILLVSLCSAASLTIVSGAQAADLPVKAKAVEYVRVCSLYGAGFFYIPGTDTCIKLGGDRPEAAVLRSCAIFGLQARLYEMSLMDFSACSSTGPQCTRR